MDKKYKAFQIYALVICVVAVITFLITTANLIFSVIDRQDPINAGRYEINLSSFENFKMETLKSTTSNQAYIPDDAVMLKMYNSAVEQKINSIMHSTGRAITVNSIILLIAIILFIAHVFLIRYLSKKSLKNTGAVNV